MFIPIRTDSPLRSTPWMNWLLIAINVVIFFLEKYGANFDAYVLDGSSPELPQFITYAFLHGGALHLVGNMVFLYIFGNNVCDRFGNLGYLGLYLGGGVFAALCYALVSDSPMIGASGAVSAITGAYIVLLPRSYITILYVFFFIGVTEIPSLYFIIFFFVKDLFLAHVSSGSNVAHEAHIAGSVFGFLLSLLLQAVRLLPRDQFDMMSLLDRWKRRRGYGRMVRETGSPIRSSREPARMPELAQSGPVAELRAQLSEAIAHRRIGDAAAAFIQMRQLDKNQTLPRQTLQEIGSYLYSMREYAHAADAFEMFLAQPGGARDADQVTLMLGLIYARYLQRPDRARECLTQAAQLARGERERHLAELELRRIAEAPPP
jgi:membrane associated rhomboid family serine protease